MMGTGVLRRGGRERAGGRQSHSCEVKMVSFIGVAWGPLDTPREARPFKRERGLSADLKGEGSRPSSGGWAGMAAR